MRGKRYKDFEEFKSVMEHETGVVVEDLASLFRALRELHARERLDLVPFEDQVEEWIRLLEGVVRCPRCGHEWRYKGRSVYATCPSCLSKVRIKK